MEGAMARGETTHAGDEDIAAVMQPEQRGDVQVLTVNFSGRAQRRLRRHAARARLNRVDDVLVVEDCVDVDAVMQQDPVEVPSDDELPSSEALSGRRANIIRQPSNVYMNHRAREALAEEGSRGDVGFEINELFPSRRPTEDGSGHVSQTPHTRIPNPLLGSWSNSGASSSSAHTEPAAMQRRHTSRSRSPRAPESAAGPPQDLALTRGAIGERSLVPMLSQERPNWVIPTPTRPWPQLTAQREANFYVELIRNGMFPSCCSVCHEFFLVGTLRLGYAPAVYSGLGTPATRGSPGARPPPPQWIHVPRCVRRANIDVHLEEHIAFSSFIPDQERERVLQELISQHLLSVRLPGMPIAPRLPTRPWSYSPASQQQWPISRISMLAGRPGSESIAEVTAQRLRGLIEYFRAVAGAAVAARGAVVAVGSPMEGEEEDRELIAGMLATVPEHRLEKREPEPCVICHETMQAGEEVRRLPCLHLFHRGCIDRWLGVKATCPLDNWKLVDMLSAHHSIGGGGGAQSQWPPSASSGG